MSTLNDHHIEVLNSLIETTLDSADGYRDAAKGAKNPRFKTIFDRRWMERKQLTAELQSQVRSLGGKPADEGRMLASAHRMFLNLKNMVTGSDQSVVNEVEAGEDYIMAKFENVLSEENLPLPVNDIVFRACVLIRAQHDDMRDLKHNLSGLDAAATVDHV